MLTGMAPFGSLTMRIFAQHFGAAKSLAAAGAACLMAAMIFGLYLPVFKKQVHTLLAAREATVAKEGGQEKPGAR